MAEKIIQLENGAVFKAVSPGDNFAGGFLTETGAKEVNASRAQAAAGVDDTVGEKLARNILHNEAQKNPADPIHAEQVFRKMTAREENIFLRRK